MKLSEYAKIHGCCYRTAWNRFKAGKINGEIDETGHIVLVKRTAIKPEYNVIYSRVSSTENKLDLDRQADRLLQYCNAKGWQVHAQIKEIGSGVNDNRPKLLKILQDGTPTRLIIEHKDRLTRFGFNYIQILCDHINCELHVINQVDNDTEDLVQDFVSIITSFCARIYGQRRSKRKTEQLIKELQSND